MMAGGGFIGQIPSWPSSGWGQAPWHTFLMVSMSVCPYLGVPSHQLVYKSCTLARPSVLSALFLPLYSSVLYPSQSCTGPGHLSCQLSLYLYTVQSSILLNPLQGPATCLVSSLSTFIQFMQSSCLLNPVQGPAICLVSSLSTYCIYSSVLYPFQSLF